MVGVQFIQGIVQFLSLLWAPSAGIVKPVLPVRPPRVIAHVIIHGTILPGLSRQFLIHNQVMLPEDGLAEISDSAIKLWQEKKLPRKLKRSAAVHIVAAYDQFVEKNGIINKYYAYSWRGVLDNQYRYCEAHKLYHQLAQLRDTLVHEYPGSPVTFILHGHSHGGNVILYLAHYEKIYKKQLPISVAWLHATPIQQETVRFAKDSLFKTIIIMYSEGDYIQNNDCFSSKRSHRRFSDLINLRDAPNNIYEVCACAAQKASAFGHASFFWLSYYQLTRIHRGKRPHHLAMIALNPFPLISYSPLIFPLLGTFQPNRGVIQLCAEGGPQTCAFTAMRNKEYAKSKNIYEELSVIKQLFKKNWY